RFRRINRRSAAAANATAGGRVALQPPDTARSVPLRPMPPPVQTKDPRIVALPAAEVRRRFVEYFADRGHPPVASASLVPAGDATLLFTNSGMVQFKDVLIG